MIGFDLRGAVVPAHRQLHFAVSFGGSDDLMLGQQRKLSDHALLQPPGARRTVRLGDNAPASVFGQQREKAWPFGISAASPSVAQTRFRPANTLVQRLRGVKLRVPSNRRRPGEQTNVGAMFTQEGR